MTRLALSALTTLSWPLEEDLEQVAAAGYDAIGLFHQKVVDTTATDVAQQLEQSGLGVSSYSWIAGFTGSEGISYRDALSEATRTMEMARKLGAPCVVVYTGGRAGHTMNHARRLFRSAIESLLPTAEKLGITLAVEPMHPACAGDWTLFTSAADCLEFVREVASPKLKMVLDLYHLAWPEVRDIPLAELADQAALVQVADGRHPPNLEQNRCSLGTGIVPLQEMIDEVLEAGYAGPLEVELWGEDVENEDNETLIRSCRRHLEEIVSSLPRK